MSNPQVSVALGHRKLILAPWCDRWGLRRVSLGRRSEQLIRAKAQEDEKALTCRLCEDPWVGGGDEEPMLALRGPCAACRCEVLRDGKARKKAPRAQEGGVAAEVGALRPQLLSAASERALAAGSGSLNRLRRA